MRLLTTAIPLLLSSVVVLGHRRPAHPARHDQLAHKRQDDATDDDVLGGLFGNSGSNSTSVATPTTRPTTSSPISSPISVRPTSTPASSAVSSSLISSSILPSSSLLPSIGVNSTRASASANATESSTSASITPTSSASSVESSIAASSEAVTTVTTDPGGEVKVITKIMTASASAASDGAAASSAAAKSGDSGISTGAIIGISVAAGVVVLSLVACAIWRMKRRGSDEDEAIRWPELNRHGDSDVHHALPARQTGHHGFETGLERSLSNSSDVFAPSTHSGPHSAAPMALNGSNFGAGSPLDEYEYDEKNAPALPPLPGQAHPHSPYDVEEDYANMPPAVMQQAPSMHAYGGYDSEEEGRPPMPPHAHSQESQMGMVQGGAPATYYHNGH